MKSLPAGVHQKEYFLENKFFADIDGDEVQRGKINVELVIKSTESMFDMSFQISGSVVVACDRCLDSMELSVASKNRLIVKFGEEYAEESDEIIIIPEAEGEINLAWFIYEFVALALPMKHVHAAGKCNKTMATKLKKHAARSVDLDDECDVIIEEDLIGDQDQDIQTDPRWDALKDLAENNNN